MLGIPFAIELYEYFGNNFNDTAIAKKVRATDAETLYALIKHNKLNVAGKLDLFETKAISPYQKYTVAEWLRPQIQMTVVDFVRIEYNRQRFPISYDALGLNNYKNTEIATTVCTFSYAEMFLYLWEVHYGSIPETATEIARLRRDNEKLRFENEKMRHLLLHRK